jgi:hypothetical protein
MIVGGILMVLSPMLGFLMTVFGMRSAFDTLGSKDISDPQRLSENIGVVLYGHMISLGGFLAGVIILAISIVLFVRAARPLDRTEDMDQNTAKGLRS